VARAAPTPIHVDLGLLAFGVHDGDAGTFGIGGQAVLFAETLSLVALVEGTGERQHALGPGQAGYSSLRLGVGGGVRKSWTSLFVDFALAPEIVRHALRGTGLTQSNRVTAWGIEADGRARLGWSAGWVASFLYLGASWSLLREHLTLTDRSDSITLSRANLAAGLGISFMVR
jgi:hypothetical protein